jgi:rare lipoprotein A
MNTIKKLLFICFCLTQISACLYNGRYTQRVDSAPQRIPDSIATKSAIPHYEPYREFNSRPYTVLGKHYTPLKTGKGFAQQGDASWYGQKFHGHLTSNGETYDMYAMTAAHKTLPLPSFVKVTNMINGKQVIVRVNDRGPFHGDRIIDLSYAAAKKLDYLKTGTAPVKVEVIHFDEQNRVTIGRGKTMSYAEYAGIKPAVNPEPAPPRQAVEESAKIYIQVAALTDKSSVRNLSEDLNTKYNVGSDTQVTNDIYRLRLGPIENQHLADMLLNELRNNGFPQAFTVTSD